MAGAAAAQTVWARPLSSFLLTALPFIRIQMREPILGFLRQAPSEHSSFETTRQQLAALSARIDGAAQRRNVA